MFFKVIISHLIWKQEIYHSPIVQQQNIFSSEDLQAPFFFSPPPPKMQQGRRLVLTSSNIFVPTSNSTYICDIGNRRSSQSKMFCMQGPAKLALRRQGARSFSVVHDYSLNEKSRSVVSFFNQSAIDSAAIKVSIFHLFSFSLFHLLCSN